MDDIKNVLKKF